VPGSLVDIFCVSEIDSTSTNSSMSSISVTCLKALRACIIDHPPCKRVRSCAHARAQRRANWHLTTRKSKIMSQPLCICFSYLTHETFPQQALEGGIVNRCLQLIERPSLAPPLLSQILWVLLSLFADEGY
jgi:hypothetical protein